MKCLITGAGGLIGSALSRQLAEQGAELVLLYRQRPPPLQAVQSMSLDFATAPVEPALLQGVENVYHCAAIAHQSATPLQYQQVNHEATLALAERAEQAGVRRFIFLSSVKAELAGAGYGRWKLRTEQALQQRHAGGGMAVISLRPALVYGGAAQGNLATLVAAARRGLPLPPASGGRSLIALPDLVQVLCMLGSTELPGYSCFTATDGESYSTQRLFKAVNTALGRKVARQWLPAPLWRLACLGMDILRGTDGEGHYQKLFGNEVYCNRTLCEALRWQPRYTFESLVDDVVEGAG